MKTLNITRAKLLGVALLGTFALSPLTLTASAQPGRGPEPRRGRGPDRRPESPRPPYGRGPQDKKWDKKWDKNNKWDKRDRDRDRNDRDRYDRDRDRDRNDRDRNDRDRNTTSYSGTVTSVRSNGFDLRANGRTYNVYLSSGVPRGLSRGDEVRVSGRSYGDNDIRNATVRITRNR